MVAEATPEPFRQYALVHGRGFCDPGKRDRVETALEVPFHNPGGGVFLPHCLEAVVNRVRPPAFGPKALGVTIGLGFGDWLQRR
jgi:hypothetical protein